MLTRQDKKDQIGKLSDKLSRSKASFLVNCIGLNVQEMTDLRKNLKQNQGDIQVIRNTLSLRAIEQDKILKGSYKSHIEGTNAFVVAFEDVAKVAKIIDQLSEENEIFKIKTAVLEGVPFSSQQVKTLAKLPSKDVLKAQFLGLLSASLTQFLLTIKEVPQAFVRVLESKRARK